MPRSYPEPFGLFFFFFKEAKETLDFYLWYFSSLFKMEETGLYGVSIPFLWFISLGS